MRATELRFAMSRDAQSDVGLRTLVAGSMALLIQSRTQRLCPVTSNGTARSAVDLAIGRPAARGGFIAPVLIPPSSRSHPFLVANLIRWGVLGNPFWGSSYDFRVARLIQRFSVAEIRSSIDVSVIRLGHGFAS